MRIGELSRQSGIVVPTIKYYLRMGLLPAGVPTAHNQAEYGPEHLHRLRLVDALVGVGGMTVTGARAVLGAVDDPRVTPAGLLTAVEQAISTRHPRGAGERNQAAAARVAATLDRRGWRSPATAMHERLTDACAVAAVLDLTELWPALDQYAAAAAESAECDLGVLGLHAVRRRLGPDLSDLALREAVVMVAVLGGVVQTAMNGMARRDALVRLLAAGSPDPG